MREPKYSHEAFGYTRHGRRWNLWQWTPGIASEFIHHFPDINQVDPTRPVVLMYRSSNKEEVRLGKHDDGLTQAIEELGRYGVKLGGRLKAVFDGVESSSIYNYRRMLEEALECAREHNAIFVPGMTRDRLLRSHSFDGTTKSESPTIAEYMGFMRMADDVPVALLLPPDTPVKGVSTKRGIAAARARRATETKWEPSQRECLDAVLKLMKNIPY